MSKSRQGHTGEERLLRLADGELTPRESAEVREHLEACWECRAGMESLQSAVADCVHYRKSVLQTHLPEPPAPWRDLTAGFRAVDREIAGESSWWRILWQGVSAPRFWVPAVAAGLMVSFVLLPWLRETPTVRAAELLRRAVAAAENSPAKPARRLQVRTRSKKLVRPVAAAAELRPVAAMFERAGYDWADPLSARAYLDWHRQLPLKEDAVVSEGSEYFRVVTKTSGELTEASLKLRQVDLEPVEGVFKFRGDEWVELSEAPDAPVAPAVVASARRNEAPVAAAAEASVADEMQVLAALHKIGADLGDPLEVVRSGARVEVRGFGVDPRRRARIAEALRAVPVAAVSFTDEAARAGSGPAMPTRALAVKAKPSSILEERLGGPAAIEQFTNEAVDRDEQILGRAHAVDRLAARFPSPDGLAGAEREQYRAMQRNHADALLKLVEELAAVLRPLATPVLPAAASAGANPRSILQAARRLERSLAAVLGAGSNDQASEAQALERMGAELGELMQLTRAYRESMGQ